MSKVIDLPGGHHATIRDVDELTVKQRRMVQASGLLTARRMARIPSETLEAIQAAQKNGTLESITSSDERLEGLMEMLPATVDEAMDMMGTQDNAIVAFLAGWDLDRPLPTTAAMVEDLPGPLYDALAEAVAPSVSKLTVGGSVDFDVVPDTPENAAAPFVDSATSN